MAERKVYQLVGRVRRDGKAYGPGTDRPTIDFDEAEVVWAQALGVLGEEVLGAPVSPPPDGSNAHGIGPDTDGGPNPNDVAPAEPVAADQPSTKKPRRGAK
jgi:hypothetical protein